MSSAAGDAISANQPLPSAAPAAVPFLRPRLTFSFSAGGWFQIYHFGVAQAIRDAGLCERFELRLCGTSAGALAVTALACNADFGAMRDFSLECGDHCRLHWWHVFRMREYLLASIQRFGTTPFAEEHLAASVAGLKRVEVYATQLPWLRTKIFTNLASFEDSREAVLASCCFTPVVGPPFQLRSTGEWVMDGGIVNFQPRVGEAGVITVCPFYFSEAHIKPSIVVPVWWGLQPPPRTDHRKLFDLGYNDALEYFVRTGYAPRSMLDRQKPAVKFSVRRGPFAFVRDFGIALLYLFLLRPLAVLAVYLELFAIAAVCIVHALWRDPRAWSDVYQNWRNLVSARTFLNLWVTAMIPINELRLSKYSRFYRLLRPLVFKPLGKHRPGKEGGGEGCAFDDDGPRRQSSGDEAVDEGGEARQHQRRTAGRRIHHHLYVGAKRWIVDTFFRRKDDSPVGATVYMHHEMHDEAGHAPR